jgi:hypothetical protein
LRGCSALSRVDIAARKWASKDFIREVEDLLQMDDTFACIPLHITLVKLLLRAEKFDM